ncbi:unnamed protein product [Rotaria sordida]|uniref:Uncharacterized protein n=1 Tax=Rotaria sordida TaxID=392033 RepID=A0A814F474_9BILA|nr:unnamed protein product [Rotaria sordida]CAF1040345.1 unnamed protein product [Rotaria sordida]
MLLLTCETFATHIITEMIYGIHLLLILQLPPDQRNNIDSTMNKMLGYLNDHNSRLKPNRKDGLVLDQIISTRVYSNICDLNRMIKFEDVYQRILELQKNIDEHQSLKYILTPIHWFYDQYAVYMPIYLSYESNEIEILENYLLSRFSQLKILNFHLQYCLRELFEEQMKDLRKKFHQQLTDIIMKILTTFKDLKTLIISNQRFDEHYLHVPTVTELTKLSTYLDINEIMKIYQSITF